VTSKRKTGRRWGMRHGCKHPGCTAMYYSLNGLEDHEKERHVQCRCGAWFSYRGIHQHVAQKRRNGDSGHGV
jgi:hypothetical protein